MHFLGQINDAKLTMDVSEESDMLRSTLNEYFVDVYANITYKTIMRFMRSATSCGDYKAVFKTDEDL